MLTKSLIKKLFILTGFLGLAFFAFLIDLSFRELDLSRIINSLLIVSGLYFLIRILAEFLVNRGINNTRTQYSLKKVLRILFLAISILALITIWVENTESLLVSYGLVSAGVALALQDVIKNFFGGISIYLTGIFNVGDRIEISDQVGDVIDIDLFYTAILEIRNWVDGDQPTGRIIYIPNHQIVYKPVHNFTKDHKFIWDEIKLPLTYDSDWRKARTILLKSISEIISEDLNNAQTQLKYLGNKYYLEERNLKPVIYITPTDNWLELNIRYVVNTFERRERQNVVQESIVEMIENNDDISIASQTLIVYPQNSNNEN